MQFVLRMLAVIVAVLVSSAAFAQGAGQGPVATACADDIKKMCADKEHGSGAVRACLEANKDKVSADCKAALDSTGGGRKQ